VVRGYGAGRGVNRVRGRIIRNYKRTEHTERLAADIRELNGFLARCKLTGGEHLGYTRNFNNRSWKKVVGSTASGVATSSSRRRSACA
jgi:hypothetical protein